MELTIQSESIGKKGSPAASREPFTIPVGSEIPIDDSLSRRKNGH